MRIKSIRFTKTNRYLREEKKLTMRQLEDVERALHKLMAMFLAGMNAPGLRPKGLKNYPGEFELSWSGDGRVRFRYGVAEQPNEKVIELLRVGGHEIFK